MSIRNIDAVTVPPPEVVRGLDDEDEQQDGGWVAWSQVAAAFALYFNHLCVFASTSLQLITNLGPVAS